MSSDTVKSKEEQLFEALGHTGDFWEDERRIVELIEGGPFASLSTPAQLNINARDKSGNTCLHYLGCGNVLIDEETSHLNSFAGDEYLLAKGADANILNNAGETPLKRLIKMYRSSPVSQGEVTYHTALIQATSKENLNKIYPDGETILTDYAANNMNMPDNEPVLRAFVQAGADVNAPNAAGKTPFRVLMERMIGINMDQGAVFETRWQLQSRKETETAILALGALQFLQAGAQLTPSDAMMMEKNVNRIKSDSEISSLGQIIETFIDLAQDYSGLPTNAKTKIAQDKLSRIDEMCGLFHKWYYGKYAGAVKALLTDKFTRLLQDVNVKDSDGQTLLCVAVKTNNQPMMENLLKRGADIDTVLNDGTTLLHIAAQAGCAPMVDLILRKGKTPVNAQNDAGDTPLHSAAQQDEIFAKLVQAGGDFSIQNKAGKTPVDMIENLETRVACLTQLVNCLQEVVHSSPALVASYKKKIMHFGRQNQKE